MLSWLPVVLALSAMLVLEVDGEVSERGGNEDIAALTDPLGFSGCDGPDEVGEVVDAEVLEAVSVLLASPLQSGAPFSVEVGAGLEPAPGDAADDGLTSVAFKSSRGFGTLEELVSSGFPEPFEPASCFFSDILHYLRIPTQKASS